MEFVVADDELWLSAFGVAPQTDGASGNELTREVRIPLSATEDLHLTWDVSGQSVRVRYDQGSNVIIDIYREQATLLTIEDHETEPVVALEYYAEGCRGRALVRTRPTFALKDTFLRT